MANRCNDIRDEKFFSSEQLPLAFHPGDTLEEKLIEMGMSVEKFAQLSSQSEDSIKAVIDGKADLTPELALSFERVTLIPAGFWLNLQAQYDSFIRRHQESEGRKDVHRKERLLSDKSSFGWMTRRVSSL